MGSMSRSQLSLMLMSRFPLSLTSTLSPLPPQLLLMLPPPLSLLPQLLMLLPLLLTDMLELLLPLLTDMLEPLLLLLTDMLEPLLLLPTALLPTNLRKLSTACYFYKDRLPKVHLSEWSGVF